MADPVTINLRHVARDLGIPLKQVEAVVELLDEGNTVPFITRYRKDQSGGLDEEQLRQVQARLRKLRALAERKQTILRSIEAQAKLDEKLAKQIQTAGTTKRLEDLYLPFKPKKQTLATTARTRGLEPLANEILDAVVGSEELDKRAADFVNPDRRVPTAAEALLGAGHIMAEVFSERAELRQRLREILQRAGKLVSAQISPEGEKAERPDEPAAVTAPAEPAGSPEPAAEAPSVAAAPAVEGLAAPEIPAAPVESSPTEPAPSEISSPEPTVGELHEVVVPAEPAAEVVMAEGTAGMAEPETPPTDSARADSASAVAPAEPGPAVAPAVPPTKEAAPTQGSVKSRGKSSKAELKRQQKEQKKKKAEERKQKAFADYYQYSEELKRIPPHRVLAINRGERARVLRVRIECELDPMYQAVDEVCVPPGHPHADFLRGCARDALTRLILPSLEREIRRELTERAETHAVQVFAKNLRNLLLQPPIHDRRVLAVDPGFKSGCKLVAMDQFGSVLEHSTIYLVGKPDRRAEAKRKVVELMEKHDLSVVAVGNGTACRTTEDFVAELLGTELKEKGAAYVIVNEAGASVYSTSRIGREEFPHYDATLRGAISIGRRLQDPLSELVKIEPANIGVGLYQHDVKAKHLQESLDEVVESCVNYVGVDVNTASPALLRYVSGLNQLTARRLYEHRIQNGPFRSRQQLKEVTGIGDATYVQAAGFLKITGGDNPLDATWIHPESYEITDRVMAKLGWTAADLVNRETATAHAEQIAKADAAALAAELQVGVMTLKDILAQLARPGRDPREDLPPPVFKRGVLKLEDLTPGMELTGTVLNVVDFGAFVDIGMHDSGLVHVSQMADRFVRDPHEVIAVGDVVKVWVLEVDKQRRRVSLTMIQPGHERAKPQPHGRPEGPRGERTDRPPRTEGRPAQGARPPRPPRPEGQGGPPAKRPDRPRPERRPPPSRGESRPPAKEPPKPRPQPKPLPPLADEVKSGKSPMRSFGELMQFYDIPQGPPRRQDEGRRRDEGRRGKDDQRKKDERRKTSDGGPQAKAPPEAKPKDAAPPEVAPPAGGPPAAPETLPPAATLPPQPPIAEPEPTPDASAPPEASPQPPASDPSQPPPAA